MPRYQAQEVAWLLFYSMQRLSFSQIVYLFNRRFQPSRTIDAIAKKLRDVKVTNSLLNDGHDLNLDKTRRYLEGLMLEHQLHQPRIDDGLPDEDREALKGKLIFTWMLK